MQLEQIVSKVQKSLPGVTKEAVEIALKKLNRRPEQIGDNNIAAIVKTIGSSAIKPVENKLVTVDTQGDQQQANESAALARPKAQPLAKPKQENGLSKRQKHSLQKANVQPVEPTEGYENLAIDLVREAATNLNDQLTEIEIQKARNLVDQVMPEIVRHRVNESPKNVAMHTQAYLEEVAEDLTPKFRTFDQTVDTRISQAASQLISEFTSNTGV